MGAIRVAHVITGLEVGGAENMLCKLLGSMGGESLVVSLMARGPLQDRLDSLGIPVVNLGLPRGRIYPGAAWRLAKAIRHFRPGVVQGWMYHGNLAAWWAALFAQKPVDLYWTIRQSLDSLAFENSLTRLTIRAGARLSARPRRIVYNSRAACAQHEAIGYAPARSRFIANGFDLDAFSPAPQLRARVRAELGLGPDQLVIGLPARFHPMKDHGNFLHAAAMFGQSRPDAVFVLVGEGTDGPQAESLSRRFAPGVPILALGVRRDMNGLYNALDICSLSSSRGEAFPNVLGEAMCCGLPVVATDVGDCRDIVGEAGIVVPAGDPLALSQAWAQLAAAGVEGRAGMGSRGRARIQRSFSLAAVASEFQAMYQGH